MLATMIEREAPYDQPWRVEILLLIRAPFMLLKSEGRMNAVAFCSLVLVFASCPGFEDSRAEVTFLGPTPYLSTADSPFAEYLDRPDFFLEDFEDGELNTPGIFQPEHVLFGTAWQGEVMGPGEFTDSVDADEGTVDGLGTGGHSFRSGAWLVSPTGIQRNQVSFFF